MSMPIFPTTVQSPAKISVPLYYVRARFIRDFISHRGRLAWPILLFVATLLVGTVEWSQPGLAETVPPPGRIRIFKETEPSGDATEFSFQFTSATVTHNFSLADSGLEELQNLAPGDGYAVSETVPTGWQLKSATCNNGSPVTNINVASNEVVDCTFVNVKAATITVKVTTLPDDDQSTFFSFAAGGGLSPATFQLRNGKSRSFANLTPGNDYSLAQTVPPGWMVGEASCSDGSPITKIDVRAGEVVTCIFVNKQLGKLFIRKITNPNPDRTGTDFTFTTNNTLTPNTFTLENGEEHRYTNLEPKAGYVIQEATTPSWELTSSICDNGSPVTNIQIDPGETVSCTFTNRGTLVDLTLAKEDGGITAEPGDTIVYTLRYRNHGTQTAPGVTITEQVPANTTFEATPDIAALWSCADNAPAGTICRHTVGALAGNTQGQVEFHVRVISPLSAAVKQIENQATIGYSDNANMAQSSTSTPIKAKALLTLNKSDDGAKAQPGDTILYTLAYKNEDTQLLTNVRITETVPLHTSYVALDQSWSCANGAPAGTQCIRTLGNVEGGEGGDIPFQVRVDASLPPAVFLIENQATIGNPLLPNADTGSEQTELQASPDLAIAIDDKGASVAPGGHVSYNIAYSNVGAQAATGVQIKVVLPTQATFIAGESTDGWQCSSTLCTFAVGILASGGSGNLAWTMQLNRPIPVDSTTLIVNVTIGDDGENGPDPVSANNLATEETSIVDPGKVTATKAVALVVDQNHDGKVAPGDTLEYLITIRNQRGSAVRDVILRDTLPDGIDLLAGMSVSQGTILAGNTGGARQIQVDVGRIEADSNATIRFRTMVHLPLPNEVVEVANQGEVTGRDFATLVTDDPATSASHDPTVTPILAAAAIEMTLADFLLIDANGDALVSVGDTLIYRLIVENRGDGGSDALQIRVPLVDNVVLVEEAVTTTAGSVRAGNDPADREVRVDIGELAGRAEVRISFQVRIIPVSGTSTIQHQAVASSQGVGGQTDIYSDDPDTTSSDDPTITTLNQAIVTRYPLYLPLIQRE